MKLITMAIASLPLLAALVLLRRKKLGWKKALIVVLAVMIAQVGILWLLNTYFVYKTPEAYAAAHFGRGKAQTILVGEESAFVIGPDGSSTQECFILEKTEKGWRRGDVLKAEIDTWFLSEDCDLTVFHRKDTGDYYIEVLLFSDGEHSVADTLGSSFQEVRESSGFVKYYAWARDLPDDYGITVDGAEYSFPPAED